MNRRKREAKTPVNFIFQVEVEEKCPYWSILKYYQQLGKEKSRQMLIESAASFWQPFVSEDKQKKDLKKAIYQLQQRVLYLQSQFLVEEAAVGEAKLRPLPYQRRESLSFDFRYQARAPEMGKLVEYLMDLQDRLTPQQKILWSSVAYWGAIADRELGLLDEAGLNQSAVNCIIRLRQHIEYLEDYFQLKEVPAAPVLAVPASWGVAAASKVSSEPLKPSSEEDEAKESSETELDPEIQRLLRGDPETDRYMAEMFASL